MRQKSKIRWLKFDNQNTAFFHLSLGSHLSCNSLCSMVNSKCFRLTTHDGVTQVVVNYLRNSLGSQNIGYRELSPWIDDIVQFRWSEECSMALQAPIGREKVRRVLFFMDRGKAPSPDGFCIGFFKGA